MKISRILHAGYVFECGDTQIAFDPIFENPFSHNCYAFPEVSFDHDQIKNLCLDAVFISHFHDDHCSLESLQLLDRSTPIYIYCLHDEILALIRELGFKSVYSIAVNEKINIGDFAVIPRRALDAEVDSLFHIHADGLNVLNVVDSWIDPETLLLLSETVWDMILWPFQTMREIEVLTPSRAPMSLPELPPEWTDQLKILNPRYLVPSSCQLIHESWSWYNHAFFPISYQHFQKEMNSLLPNTKVIRLNPSVSVLLGKNSYEMSSPLQWIEPVGSQDVDYDYRPYLKAPHTAQIASHFKALTAEQAERVHHFCNNEIFDKYKILGPPADIYFNKPRLWRLSVYDHNGRSIDYHYSVDGDNLTKVAKESGVLSWFTELPIAKLYAALELGESLTSLYIRINDMIFDAQIEKEIALADVVDDPLVRCLFNGRAGAYQAAQLKRIRARQTI